MPDENRVFDITKPSHVNPSATSKPVIVGHQPLMSDPMVRDQAGPGSEPTRIQVNDSPSFESRAVNEPPAENTSPSFLESPASEPAPARAPEPTPEPASQSFEAPAAFSASSPFNSPDPAPRRSLKPLYRRPKLRLSLISKNCTLPNLNGGASGRWLCWCFWLCWPGPIWQLIPA